MKYIDYIQFKNESLKIRDTEGRGLIQDNANEIASVKSKANLNEQKINALTPRVDQAEEDIDSLKTRMTTAENDIDVAETRILANEAAILGLDNRLDVVEPAVETLGQKVNSLETAVDSIEDDIALIQGKDIEQDGRLDDLEGDVGTLKTKITAAEGRLDDIEAVNRAQDDAIQELDEKIVASTYEAGIGIYFGQGVDHTNINVEDELLDEIHASTAKNIEQDDRLDDIEADAVYGVEVVPGDTKKIKVVGKTDDIKNIINGTVTSTPSGSVSQPTFTGTQSTISVSGTPSGSVSQPTFTGDAVSISGTVTPTGNISGTGVSLGTKSISEIISVGTLPSKAADTYVAPSASYDSSTETITFTPGSFSEGAFSAGTLPTSSSTTVADGSATVTDPTFTGDQVSISGTVTPTGTVSQPTFTGTQMTSTGTYTPAGSVSKPTFTGTEATIDVIFADGGSIQPLTLVASPASTQENPITKNIRYTQTQSLIETFTFTTNRAVLAVFISEISIVAYGGSYSGYISINSQLPTRVDDNTYTINVIYRTASASPQLISSWKTQKITLEAIDEYGQKASASAYLKVIVN